MSDGLRLTLTFQDNKISSLLLLHSKVALSGGALQCMLHDLGTVACSIHVPRKQVHNMLEFVQNHQNIGMTGILTVEAIRLASRSVQKCGLKCPPRFINACLGCQLPKQSHPSKLTFQHCANLGGCWKQLGRNSWTSLQRGFSKQIYNRVEYSPI